MFITVIGYKVLIVYTGVIKLGHMVGSAVFNFSRQSVLAVLVYTPISSKQGFLFLHILFFSLLVQACNPSPCEAEAEAEPCSQVSPSLILRLCQLNQTKPNHRSPKTKKAAPLLQTNKSQVFGQFIFSSGNTHPFCLKKL